MLTVEHFDRELFHAGGSTPCVVSCGPGPDFAVSVVCEELSCRVSATGASLTRSFDSVRLVLEERGLLLGCAGARLDVTITPLLEAEWDGRRAHLISTPRKSTSQPLATLDIFDRAPSELVVTLLAQEAEARAFARGKSKWSVTAGR